MGFGSLAFWNLYSRRPGVRKRKLSDVESIHASSFERIPTPTDSRSFHTFQTASTREGVQQALVLESIRTPYKLIDNHPDPVIETPDELLIEVRAIGLNPIDWKAPDYGFGIPELPYKAGRDLVGVVVEAPSTKSHISKGDLVIVASTDYRDPRKAAFQQAAIATESTVSRVPRHLDPVKSASLGVAFVSAALALGICLGLDFSRTVDHSKGPDLSEIIRTIEPARISDDLSEECLRGSGADERLGEGDWIVIWGGSTTTGFIATQLAKLAGCRVALVLDVAKHGARLSQQAQQSARESAADFLIDNANPDRAIQIIRQIAGGRLRFAIDTTGKETATKLLEALTLDSKEGEEDTPVGSKQAHLVGFSGLPKEQVPNVVYHKIPIKAFHEIPEVGGAISIWLEELLMQNLLRLPETTVVMGGLQSINDSLDLMRRGEVSGRRLVIDLDRERTIEGDGDRKN